MNDENLRPVRTESEARERGRAGGVASGKARRAKRDMTALAKLMLSQRLQGGDEARMLALFPDLDEEATMAASVLAGQISAARGGSVRAAQFLQDMSERAEARERVERPYRIDPMDLTTDCIAPYRAVHSFFDGRLRLTDMVFRGGRGGIKSTFAARLAHEAMRQDPHANVVYGRRFATDLRDSVFTTFQKVVAEAGEVGQWSFSKSPFRATYRPTGTTAYFFGFDDAEKLKSFTPEVGYVKLLIFEEADELMGNEQMDSAADTFLRSNGYDGARQLRLRVFNPPPSRSNFMNEWCSAHAGDPEVAIFDFCYENVPREWLGEGFFIRADKARRERPEWYRNNYLGEVTGIGGELFANVEERTITDEEVRAFEDAGLVLHGLDYGYEHPMAFERVVFDRATDTVWCVGEHVQRRAKLADYLRPIERYRRQEVIVDSAEPDRMADMREWGWDVVGAVKRWGANRGRDFCWDWLRSRRRIVVDPSRTPCMARELRTLEFERVRDGFSSRYPTLGEDCVMAAIYALNREIRDASTYDG